MPSRDPSSDPARARTANKAIATLSCAHKPIEHTQVDWWLSARVHRSKPGRTEESAAVELCKAPEPACAVCGLVGSLFKHYKE